MIRHRFLAFGGSVCELLVGDGAEEDVSALVAEIYAFEAQLSRFRPDSELSRFNAAAGAPLAASALLEALLRACLSAFQMSGGLVNAAIGAALVAAGYDHGIEVVRQRGSHRNLAGAAPVPALPDVLEVGAGWARLAAGCAIDLGGVGKGWLADRLCERFGDACINLGGDLRAIGPGPSGQGWDIGLCDGRTVRVTDGGVATSGTEARRWCGGHHLIDPGTGRPTPHEAMAVSVAAWDALAAEVLAKAAILVGPQGAGGWLREHGAVEHAAIWAGEGQVSADWSGMGKVG